MRVRIVEIACGQCGTRAPELADVLADERGRTGGLNAMGWDCRGGRCTCPGCVAAMADTETEGGR